MSTFAPKEQQEQRQIPLWLCRETTFWRREKTEEGKTYRLQYTDDARLEGVSCHKDKELAEVKKMKKNIRLWNTKQSYSTLTAP